jgi:SAM-dependent methyltransferase
MENVWESRYQAKETNWDKGEPSPGLVDFLAAHPQLERGTVLVPGCGFGHDARAWALAGFTAIGVDLAPSAVRGSQERTKDDRATFRLGNFLADEPFQLFDWVFEHTLYCAIDPAQRGAYKDAVLRWLKPRGQYLAVNYLIPDVDGPPFGTTKEEVVKRFEPDFELLSQSVPRSYPNRTNLELLSWWRKRK